MNKATMKGKLLIRKNNYHGLVEGGFLRLIARLMRKTVSADYN
jgi:hypothetical protein